MSPLQSRILIPLFFPALAGLLLLSACRQEPELTGVASSSDTAYIPRTTALDIVVIYSDSGRIQARVSGPAVHRYAGEDPWMEFPDGFLIEMYDSAQRIESTITARYGKRVESSRIMEARGDVVVRNELKQEQLNTEILIWDERKHLIHAESPVKITTPGKVLYGTGLEADENFSVYKILKPRGEMMVENDSI